jgi:hypothetical protein
MNTDLLQPLTRLDDRIVSLQTTIVEAQRTAPEMVPGLRDRLSKLRTLRSRTEDAAALIKERPAA